jgi:group I intron endonuclease
VQGVNQSGIYEILNTVNGKRYIGSAIKIAQRWKQHKVALRRGVHHSIPLQRAWDKYGEQAFKFLPVLTCAKSMLLFYEQQLLDKVKPEYNVSPTAGSSLGVKASPATRDRLRVTHLGLIQSPETCEKKRAALIGNKNGCGYVPTPEQRAATSVRMLGKRYSLGNKHTAEQNAAMSAWMQGKQHALGSKQTPEQCAAKSKARKGVPWSPARRLAQEGVTWSPARRAKFNLKKEQQP